MVFVKSIKYITRYSTFNTTINRQLARRSHELEGAYSVQNTYQLSLCDQDYQNNTLCHKVCQQIWKGIVFSAPTMEGKKKHYQQYIQWLHDTYLLMCVLRIYMPCTFVLILLDCLFFYVEAKWKPRILELTSFSRTKVNISFQTIWLKRQQHVYK